jgi:hypothetical protein
MQSIPEAPGSAPGSPPTIAEPQPAGGGAGPRGAAAVIAEVSFVAGLALLIGAGSALFFHLVLRHGVETDLQPHMRMVALSLEHGAWPTNFLYYWIVGLCAGFSTEPARLERAVAMVLAGSCALRFLASVWVGHQLLREAAAWKQQPAFRYGFYIAVALLQVAHNVIDLHQQSPYLGYFPATVWHNSTTIFLMPWAILLFYFAYRALTRATAPDLCLLAAMALLNVAIKNSLVQVLVVVLPLAALVMHGLSARSVKIALALLPAVVLVGAQAMSIYGSQFTGSVLARYHEEMSISGDSTVAFEFLALWPKHTLSTILCSFLYPLLAMALLWRVMIRDPLLRFGLACIGVALVQSICLVETGYRRIHGNFTWQVLICTYLLFLAVVVVQFRLVLRQGRAEERDLVPAVAFAIHIICGLAYFGIIFASGNFRGD